MLVIRDEQIEPFRQREIERFVTEACADLREHHSDELADHSDDELRDLVHHGIDVCDSYGIETEGFILAYCHLMFDFGIDFDQDPALPWANAILHDPELDEGEVIAELLEAAKASVPGAAW